MKGRELKIVFGGTPDFAAAHLKALLDGSYNVVGVYTRQDKAQGRGQKIVASPVKELALSHDIPVFQPTDFKSAQSIAEFQALQADLFVVVAYGIILPSAILNIPTHGCINVHGSLLPKYRGAAPIQRAIYNGDLETGVTIMQMDEGLDTGDMLLKKHLPILPTDTSGSLFERLVPLGCQALIEIIDTIAQGKAQKVPQEENNSSYATKISKDEARISFTAHNAQTLVNHIRAFHPWPVANILIDNTIIKIHQATAIPQDANLPPGSIVSADKNGIRIATKQGLIQLDKIQFPGKKVVNAADAINGHKDLFKIGSILS